MLAIGDAASTVAPQVAQAVSSAMAGWDGGDGEKGDLPFGIWTINV